MPHKRSHRSSSSSSDVSVDNRKSEHRSSRHKQRHHRRSSKKRFNRKESQSQRVVKDKRSPSGHRVSERKSKHRTKSENKRREISVEQKDSNKIEDVVKVGEISLSIDDTNALRKKLGLAPLDVDDNKQTKDSHESVPSEDIHVPALNIATIKHTEQLREKIQLAKEKHLLEHNVSKVTPLAATNIELSTAEWLKQFDSKLMDHQKSTDIQSSTEAPPIESASKTKQVWNHYDSSNLRGLKVEHGEELISEGTSVILTLKDSYILKDEEDVLVNVNMVDDKIAKRNAMLRNKKFNYSNYDKDDEQILSKYDEEIYGQSIESFVLDDRGQYDAEEELARQHAREKLQSSAVRLETTLKPITDYLEPKIIKKPKKTRTVKKRILKADDLLRMDIERNDETDLKSRDEILQTLKLEDNDYVEGDVIDSVKKEIVDVDEVDIILNRTAANKRRTADIIARKLRRNRCEDDDRDEDQIDSTVVLDSMSEFCRTLGDVPIISIPTQTEANCEDNTEANEIDNDLICSVEDVVSTDNKVSDNVILDEEPLIGPGITSALKIAHTKGYLECDKSRKDARIKHQNISAQHFTIEERSHYDIDDKFSRKERYSGPLSEFREKSNYRPAVTLEYLGEDGRKMSMKEAFRYLSHRFHGKGSGKRKTEKRMLKIREEEAMKHMSSIDTPLHTASMMHEKQKELQQPYITLSASKQDPAQLLRKL
ncbi:hypothetical protein GJ496_001715 [Pomphorhynchus laevis]|nr:hypothetical protein GJ496_001715 [Pomphorhynchus laevis]